MPLAEGDHPFIVHPATLVSASERVHACPFADRGLSAPRKVRVYKRPLQFQPSCIFSPVASPFFLSLGIARRATFYGVIRTRQPEHARNLPDARSWGAGEPRSGSLRVWRYLIRFAVELLDEISVNFLGKCSGNSFMGIRLEWYANWSGLRSSLGWNQSRSSSLGMGYLYLWKFLLLEMVVTELLI